MSVMQTVMAEIERRGRSGESVLDGIHCARCSMVCAVIVDPAKPFGRAVTFCPCCSYPGCPHIPGGRLRGNDESGWRLELVEVIA